MHPIFSVSEQEIQSLDDSQARELVARLCGAELRALGLSVSAVSWGGDQRAKDGGVDVRVDAGNEVAFGGYIKSKKTVFQVKAEEFGPAKIGPEIAPKGNVRTAIKELAEAGGAYVIVSTKDSTSDSSLKSRVDAMKSCLTSFGLADAIDVDFYDARKIADWVEQNPSIAVWMKNAIGRPLEGWRPYGPWAYKENSLEAEYLVDDRVKVFTPANEQGQDIVPAIENLRSDLRRKASVRLVGLSGVGKTRLAQALFDKRIGPSGSALNSDSAIYADLSDGPTPQPIAMLEALVSQNSDCFFVVDNCGPDVHQRLTEISTRPGSRVGLLTIEYDIRDDLPEGTACYRLEGSSDEIIKELLKRKYPLLSSPDIERIADFSDGNARVAFALASTASTTGELGRLRDDDLFKRLFVQKYDSNDELLRGAEALSLLYSFDGEDVASGSELEILANVSGFTVTSLLNSAAELRRRGLLQSRGKWRALLPHAIANRLAARAIDALPKPKITKHLLDDATERIARSFSRRLGYLHASGVAQAIAGDWLAPSGRLGDLKFLTQLGKDMFANIAPIEQGAALGALERAVADQEFVSAKNHDRDDFIRITRSLSYEADRFERAANILKTFALVEPAGHNQEKAKDALKSLFHCHFSGTSAEPELRHQYVRAQVSSPALETRKLAIQLLDAGLETNNFNPHYSFEFGARKRGYGWWPRNRADVQRWFAPFIDLAVELSKATDMEMARSAQSTLGSSVRGLISDAGMISEVFEAAKALKPINGWPEGWIATKQVIHRDKEQVPAAEFSKVVELERYLAPQSLKEKVLSKILVRGHFYDDVDNEAGDESAASYAVRHHKSQLLAQELGALVAEDDEILTELFPEFFKANSNDKLGPFAYGLGKKYTDAIKLVARTHALLKTNTQGTNLQFFRSFLSGWNEQDPSGVAQFLDSALTDDIWLERFPEMQSAIELDQRGFERVLQSIKLAKAPAWQYRSFAGGRRTDPLSVQQIGQLASGISNLPNSGVETAIDLLLMVIHCANEKDKIYQSALATECMLFLAGIDWNALADLNDHIQHDIKTVLEFSLARETFSKSVINALERIIDRRRSKARRYYRERGDLLSPFFQYFPLQTLDKVYFLDKEGSYQGALQLICDPYREDSETGIRKVPDEVLIEWCNASPDDRYCFAANACKLFEKESPGTTEEILSVTNIAKLVLKNARDKLKILEIYVGRFDPNGWSGSLATILESRLPLLNEFNFDNDAELGAYIQAASAKLVERIAYWRKREDMDERVRTETFE